MSETTTQTKTKMSTRQRTRALTEAALMLALGTVLQFIPLVKMPFGGDVTAFCMLPVIIIAYRYGWITKEKLLESAARYGKSPYGKHLQAVAEGKVRG